MFGNVLCVFWLCWMQFDVENCIDFGCCVLLVCDGECNVLVEIGIGVFFLFVLCQCYGVQEECYVLFDSFVVVGLDDVDIDVVLFIYLYFDYVGGLFVVWEEGQLVCLLFFNVYFVSGCCYWQCVCQLYLCD